MSRVPVRSQAGVLVGDVELDSSLFEAQINVPVMHQVVVAQMAAWRSGTHDTKTRGEVSGGGKKPYRQKGTGRARQGSIRAPHYSGGGIVWGPHPRDYTKKVNKKMRGLALRSALSDRAREGKITVLDDLAFDVPKTKEAIAVLDAAGVSDGKVLLVVEARNETIERSFRNLQRVHVLTVDQLNTYDIIARDWLVFTRAALERLNSRGTANGGAANGGREAAASMQGGEGE